MQYIPRDLEAVVAGQLARGKSVLLLGPRQTGKTTLLQRLDTDLFVSLVDPRVRQRYERDPGQLASEIDAIQTRSGRPLVVLDEVQKAPALLDVVQEAIDGRRARFVLCGSSARKLRRGGSVNLLPGRVVSLRLDPLTIRESMPDDIEEALLFGSLPGIRTVHNVADREIDLESYATTYLEQEIRAEALARDLGAFARFLELASLESGNIVSFRSLSRELGIAHTTVASYYEVLEDTLVAERVDPVTRSRTRKKLTRSSRHLIFDLGVRRAAAREGRRVGRDRMGQLFEQFVGLELIRLSRLERGRPQVRFWRDPDGPEVDWVLERDGAYVPVETKWTDAPTTRDARHLHIFLDEYPTARRGFVVCRAPRPLRLTDRVDALPWQELGDVFA